MPTLYEFHCETAKHCAVFIFVVADDVLSAIKEANRKAAVEGVAHSFQNSDCCLSLPLSDIDHGTLEFIAMPK